MLTIVALIITYHVGLAFGRQSMRDERRRARS